MLEGVLIWLYNNDDTRLTFNNGAILVLLSDNLLRSSLLLVEATIVINNDRYKCTSSQSGKKNGEKLNSSIIIMVFDGTPVL
jgi:hypothetical protein